MCSLLKQDACTSNKEFWVQARNKDIETINRFLHTENLKLPRLHLYLYHSHQLIYNELPCQKVLTKGPYSVKFDIQ